MGTGFTFKGEHSSKYGVYRTTNRPLTPSVKEVSVTPSFCDGTIDFSDYNEAGRVYYNDRIFEGVLQIKGSDIFDLNDKVHNAAIWLMGKGRLEFDDMPGRYWDARIIQGIDYTPQILGHYAELNVAFRCAPFAEGEEIIKTAVMSADTGYEASISLDPYDGDIGVKPIISIKSDAGIEPSVYVSGLFFKNIMWADKKRSVGTNGFVIDFETGKVNDNEGRECGEISGEVVIQKTAEACSVNVRAAPIDGASEVKCELRYTPRYI